MKKFLDCISIVGATPRKFHGTKKYVSTGAVATTEIDESEVVEVTYEDRPSRANLSAEAGDILFAKMQGTRKTLLLDSETEENIYSTGFYAVRANPEVITTECLYYLIDSELFLAQKDKNCSGATQKAITNGGMAKIEISVPALSEQGILVDKLKHLTQLIADKKKQLNLFDEIIKSRFIEMFGMLNVNNKNWPQKSLGQACEQIKRYPTFCNMEYLQSGVRVIRIGNILLDGHLDTSDENYVFVYENANSDYPDTVIEENDIIMAVRGDGSAAKRIGIVTEPKLIGANISPNLIRIKAKKEMLVSLFLFYYLTGEVGQARLDAFVNKTAKKNIAAKDIVKVITPIPPIQLQREFAAFVEQVDKSKLAIQQSLEKLETLKKALMQQYFG